jgi:putative membrane protein
MQSETDLRDQLAVDRTLLANERTLLAYVRTSLALVAAGAGLLQFFDAFGTRIAGWLLIALGAIALPIGVWRYLNVRSDLLRSRDDRGKAAAGGRD